jgi:hypothetical protein
MMKGGQNLKKAYEISLESEDMPLEKEELYIHIFIFVMCPAI